jgi:hypothetical protein
VLSLGIAVLAYVLRDTFIPLPVGPFRFVALAAAGSTLLGLTLAMTPAVHRRLAGSELLRAVRGGRATDSPVDSAP